MTNLEIQNFRGNIIQTINKSNLPIGVVYYVMNDVMNELTTAFNSAIREEKQNIPEETVSFADPAEDDVIVEEENE